MNIIKTDFNPQIPLSKIEEFVDTIIGWEKGSFDVVLLMFSDREEHVYIDYPTDLNENQAQMWLDTFSLNIQVFNFENQRHPAIRQDTLIYGGALKLALNALRRAGKDEIANELEKTAERIN
jgi:hypothetical protein